MNGFKRKSLRLSIALACGTALGTGTALAQNLETTGPSLTAQTFQQVDENGVDLINGSFNIEGPSLSYGEGEGRLSAELRWTGQMWSLNTPSIWRDDDNGLFVNTGRTIDEFELQNGLWVPTRGNSSNVICTFFNPDRTQMHRCDYTGHDGTTVRFDAFNPMLPPANAYAPELGNLNARFGYATYADGRSSWVTDSGMGQFNVGLQGGLVMMGNGGAGGPATWDPSISMSLHVTVSGAAREVGRLSFYTSNLNYSNRKTRNVFRPRSVTQQITDPAGQVWRYTFNGDGDMTAVQRPGSAGNNVTLTYDSDHRVRTLTTVAGTWNYSYSSSNGIGTTNRQDPAYQLTTVTYIRKRGNVRTVRDALYRTTSYGYDSRNRLSSITFPEGNSILYTYDARGNMQTQTRYPKPGSTQGETAITVQAEYPPTCPAGGGCNLPTAMIDGNNNRTEYGYSGVRLTRVTRPAVNGVRPETRYTYTPMIRRLRRPDGTMATQAAGMPVLTQVSECRTQATCAGTADEARTMLDYGQNDPNSEVVWMPVSVATGPGDGSLSTTTGYIYTPLGDVASVDGPLYGTEDTTYNRYDAMRRPLGTIEPDPDQGGPLPNRAVRNSYNADGTLRLTEVGTVSGTSDAAWAAFAPRQLTATEYDSAGRRIRVAAAAGGVTESVTDYGYYSTNRPQCTTVRMNRPYFPAVSALGYISGGSLPAPGCTPGAVGAAGPDRITQNGYDVAGQLTQVSRGVGTAEAQAYASYSYSPNGKQRTVIDANGNRAELTYDGHDRQSHWYFPSRTLAGQTDYGDFEQYGYDNNGNRTSLRRRDNSQFSFQFDALNRMTVKIVPERLDIGIPASATRDVYYGYDLLGLQTSARFDSHSGEGITTVYDAFRRPQSSTIAMGGSSRTVTRSHEMDGNIRRVTHPDGQFFYYANGPTGQLTALYANIVSPLMTFGYDELGRPTRQTTSANARTTTTLTYDPAGRLGQIAFDMNGTPFDHNLAFTHNPAGQIASRTSSNDLYAYNAEVNVNRPYVVNGLNQYRTAGPATFDYDSSGNLRTDGLSTYLYDTENRLISASGATNAALTYDPLGRLFQVSGASVTQFLYDGNNLVGEYDGAGTMTRRFVHGRGDDRPLVWYQGADLSWPRYLHANHQGSIIGVTDPYGDGIAANAFDSWGIPDFKPSGRFLYTGQAWLPELGMYYYKARIYSPTLGRFLQTDPVGYEDQVNLYAYVGNDPVNMQDPNGTSGCWSTPEGCQPGQFFREAVVGAWRSFWGTTDQPRPTQMTFNWITGTGRTNLYFGPEHQNTQELRGSREVSRAREFLYDKYDRPLRNGDRVDGFVAQFGLGGLATTRTQTEQFTGRFRIDMVVMNDQVQYTATNNSSLRSFLYGLGPSYERMFQGMPFSNIRQTYMWYEPIRR